MKHFTIKEAQMHITALCLLKNDLYSDRTFYNRQLSVINPKSDFYKSRKAILQYIDYIIERYEKNALQEGNKETC